MINVFIVSNDLTSAKKIKTDVLNSCQDTLIVGLSNFKTITISEISNKKTNLLLIEVGECSISLLNNLEMIPNRVFEILFIASNNNYLTVGINLNVFGYLIKPINRLILGELFEKIKKQSVRFRLFDNYQKTIKIKTNRGDEFIEIKNIIRFEAVGSYSKVFTHEKKSYLISKHLKEIEDLTNRKVFFRTHKSHLININHITFINNCKINEITMSDNSIVKLSKTKKDLFYKLERH